MEDIEITYEGKIYSGKFKVTRGGIVCVYYGNSKKCTQVGNSPAKAIAKWLLTELVQEKRA